jgi:hypothetical protein
MDVELVVAVERIEPVVDGSFETLDFDTQGGRPAAGDDDFIGGRVLRRGSKLLGERRRADAKEHEQPQRSHDRTHFRRRRAS